MSSHPFFAGARVWEDRKMSEDNKKYRLFSILICHQIPMLVEIIEVEACADHIHMLVSIPSKLSVSEFIE